MSHWPNNIQERNQTKTYESHIDHKRRHYQKQIRKEQISTLKRTKRMCLLDNRTLELPQTLSQPRVISQRYSLSLLLEHGNSYLQMLKEEIEMPVHSLNRQQYRQILNVLLEFVEWQRSGSIKENQEILVSRKIEVDVEGIELISIYSLWNLCNVIDIQLLLSLFVAIYYEAIDVQEGVTSHVIAFLLQLMQFSYVEFDKLDKCLKYFIPSSERTTTMPKISRRLILNAFWNISYSEDECNVSLLVAGVAFDSIQTYLVDYGFTEDEKENLAGLYLNCIDSLVQLSTLVNNGAVNSYFLHLQIFDSLADQTHPEIVDKTVSIGLQLLYAVNTHDYGSKVKRYITQTIQKLIYSIVTNKIMADKLPQLFVAICNYPEYFQSLLRVVQLLEFIIKYYRKIHCIESVDQSLHMMEKADKPMHHIKEIVKGAKYILKTLEDRKMVELEQMLVVQLLNMWCNDDLICCEAEFAEFLEQSLLNQKIFQLIVLETKNRYDFVDMALCLQVQQESVAVYLRMLRNYIWQVEVINRQTLKKYLGDLAGKLTLLCEKIEGFTYISQGSKEVVELSSCLHHRLKTLLDDADT